MAIRFLAEPRLNEDIRPIYRQVREEFGLWADPFRLHSAAPELLAGSWAAIREAVLVGRVPRYIKEALAVAVSQRNRCRYCIDAHTIMLHAVQQHDLVSLILSERTAEIEDGHLREVVEWGLTGHRDEAAGPANPYFSRDHLPELIATLFGFHYINRMVHIFLPETPLLLNQGQTVQRRLVGWLLGRSVPKAMTPGASLSFLAPADLSPELATMLGAEGALPGAFARWAAVIARAGHTALADGTRDFVRAYLRDWDGEAPPLGEGWLAAAVQGLPSRQAIEARLVLKAALAPHRMDASTVAAYQTLHKGDALLLGATAWGAFVTAQVVVSRAG